MTTLDVRCGPSSDSLEPLLPNVGSVTPCSTTTSVALYLRSFSGRPKAPETHSIFTGIPHKDDLFSLQIYFTPSRDINGDDLVLANLFDRPIRDSLPYFFSPAFAAAQKLFDPGLAGDAYADRPWFASPILSCMNRIRIRHSDAPLEADVMEEDMTLAGIEVPADEISRRKFFLKEENRRMFTFRRGVRYECVFCNPLVDFGRFEVHLPGLGWRVKILRYWDGQPFRFVLVDRKNGVVEGEAQGVVQFEVLTEEDPASEEETSSGNGSE